MADAFLLSDRAKRHLAEIARRRPSPRHRAQPPREAATTMVAYATSEIAAATGTISDDTGLTPGIGKVQPCYWTGTVWKKDPNAQPTDAQNVSPAESVKPNKVLLLKRVKGQWIVDFEPCES